MTGLGLDVLLSPRF